MEPLRLFRHTRQEMRTHMPTVMVVQGRTNEYRLQGEKQAFERLAQEAGVQIVFANPLQEDGFSWHNPKEALRGVDGVLFAGSSDVDLTIRNAARDLYVARVEALARHALRRGSRPFGALPVLGICLGHQMLHFTARGGEKREVRREPHQRTLRRDLSRAETGTTRVALTDNGAKDTLFTNVPMTRNEKGWGFNVIFGHKDTVVVKSRWFRRLGSTGRDANSVTRSWLGNVFTMQGHPEVTDATELKKILAMVNSQVKTMGAYEENYPAEDTPGADRVIYNFFRGVEQRATKKPLSSRTMSR